MVALLSLVILLLPGAVVAFGILLPSAVDLVRRDEEVPLWWAIPLLLWVPMLPLAGLVPMTQDPGIDQASVASGMWGATWLAASADLVMAAIALALPRGLRPDGETERRFRTTVAGVVLLGLGSVAIPIAVPFLPWVGALLWFVPAAWGGLVWLLLLNRRGPPRLENGRKASATWLFTAGGLFILGVLHVTRAVALQQDLSWQAGLVAAVAIAGTLTLMAGLRALSGPLGRVVPMVACVAVVSFLPPEIYWWTYRPLPPGVEVPRWENLIGQRPESGAYPVRSMHCARVLGTDTMWGPCDDVWLAYASIIASPSTLARDVPMERDVLMDGGLTSIAFYRPDQWNTWNVEVVEGGWVVKGTLYEDAASAHRAIERMEWAVIGVKASDGLTIQDFLRICGSSWSHQCRLDLAPPVPGDVGRLDAEMLERLQEDMEPLDPEDFEGLLGGDPDLHVGPE